MGYILMISEITLFSLSIPVRRYLNYYGQFSVGLNNNSRYVG